MLSVGGLQFSDEVTTLDKTQLARLHGIFSIAISAAKLAADCSPMPALAAKGTDAALDAIDALVTYTLDKIESIQPRDIGDKLYEIMVNEHIYGPARGFMVPGLMNKDVSEPKTVIDDAERDQRSSAGVQYANMFKLNYEMLRRIPIQSLPNP